MDDRHARPHSDSVDWLIYTVIIRWLLVDFKRSNILKFLPKQPIYFLKASVSASPNLHCIPQAKSQMFDFSYLGNYKTLDSVWTFASCAVASRAAASFLDILQNDNSNICDFDCGMQCSFELAETPAFRKYIGCVGKIFKMFDLLISTCNHLMITV